MSRKVVEKESQIVKLKMELIQKDTLLMISEGKYRKMVNYYSTQNKLNDEVKKNAPIIYDSIKNNNEKILSNTNIGFTFKPKDGVSVVDKKDSLYTFSSFYPSKDKSFIQLDGVLNTNSNKLNEKWSFNSIKLDIILTEKENGLWNSYLNAPEFVTVNSMTINSLPPEKYIPKVDKPKTLILYGGLGMRTGINSIGNFGSKDLTINGALTIKNKIMLEANYGTDEKLGAALLFKF